MKPTVKALRALGFRAVTPKSLSYYAKKIETRSDADESYLVVDPVNADIAIAWAWNWNAAVSVCRQATMADVERWLEATP